MRLCSKCKKNKPLDGTQFKLKGDGGFSKVCKSCLQQTSDKNADKRREAKNAETDNEDRDDDSDETLSTTELTELTLDIFLESIGSASHEAELRSFAVLVNLSTLPDHGGDRGKRDKDLTTLVWEHSKYRFLYVRLY